MFAKIKDSAGSLRADDSGRGDDPSRWTITATKWSVAPGPGETLRGELLGAAATDERELALQAAHQLIDKFAREVMPAITVEIALMRGGKDFV